MNKKLPNLIEKYINSSNESNLKLFLSCFSEDATVLDEGELLKGHEQITSWFLKTRKKYQFKSIPLDITENQGSYILVSEVSGNFPGSPVNLSYKFKVESGLIKDLRILA